MDAMLHYYAGRFGRSASRSYEAALVDGASTSECSTDQSSPLQPTIIAAMTLRAIDVFKTFDIVYTMTQGGRIRLRDSQYLFVCVGFQYFQMEASHCCHILCPGFGNRDYV